MRGAGRRAWAVMVLAVAAPVAAVVACSGASSPAPTNAAAGSASPLASGASGSSIVVGDASSILQMLADYADATPAVAPLASSDAAPGTTSPKIYKPAVDPAAGSPNGKCLAANAPAPDFRAAAQSAAQATLICYEYALKRAAPSPAHLEIMLDVDEDGRLRDAAVLSDDFADDKMRTCTVRKLRDTERFPSPKTGCGSLTRLPLTFLRADGGF